ncbi:MAG: hypothetical protein J6X55_13590 [Victivallales bacterium]|nr:hypothetical protein [Victivallales bacterium]
MDWLKNEWEIATLVVMVIILVLWGLFSLLTNEKTEEIIVNRPLSSEKLELLSHSGKEFLTSRETASLGTSSRPFSLPDSMLRPEEKPQPKPKFKMPSLPSIPKIQQPKTPEKKVEAEAPAPPKPLPVEPRLIGGSLYYAESQDLSNGMRVAIMKLIMQNEAISLALAKGEMAYGITIVNITEKNVYLLDAKKRKIVLKRDGETKLWVNDRSVANDGR